MLLGEVELIDQSLSERRNIPELQDVAIAASNIRSATRLVLLMDQSSIRNAVAAEKKAKCTEDSLRASRRIYSTIHTQLGTLMETRAG